MFRLGTVASSGEGRPTVNLVISADTNNYDIYANRGGDYVAGETDVTLTINSGVSVGSTSTGTYALDTGSSWATGDTITIVNNGTVKGCGGSGGDGGDSSYSVPANNNFLTDGTDGGDGGNSFRAQFACIFTNNGSVYGGGGGGGGAGGSHNAVGSKIVQTFSNAGSGGGGGAGVLAGIGGQGGTATGTSALHYNNQGADGDDGTDTAGGAGGIAGTYNGTITVSGGNGGGLGADGLAGEDGVIAGTGVRSLGSAGGIRGFYQVGSSLINSGSGIGGVVGGRSS